MVAGEEPAAPEISKMRGANDEIWDRLEPDMRMREVKNILGEPDKKLKESENKKVEIWIYSDGLELKFIKTGFVHRLVRESS